jgi:tetratricopeptide (TPR) repeat protein
MPRPNNKNYNSENKKDCTNRNNCFKNTSDKFSKKLTSKLSKKSPIEFSPGEYFGKRYKIIAEISRGELGRIYKAKDTQMNKIVALRIFNPKISDKTWMDIIQKLQEREQKKKAKAELSHAPEYEHLTKLYNIGRIGNIKYISMEYKEYNIAAKISIVLKILLCVFAATIVILIGMVIYFAFIEKKPPVPSLKAPGIKSIVVMYFENNTGDEALDHWREALSDLLITDLAQSRYIRVLSEKKLFHILKELEQLETTEYSFEVLQEVAKKGKAEYILLGSLNKAGDHFRIDIKIQEAKTAELIGSEMVEGEGEESIFAMVDELTKKIKSDFEFPEELIAEDIDKEIGQITTSSPEAYKYYRAGVKFHLNRDFRRSIQYMEKAIKIDPFFAMAYAAMAADYYNMGYETEHKKYIKKALDLTDRVSDRERYIIQARNAMFQSEETWNIAIEAYKKLLQLYPDDYISRNNLGVLYLQLEQWDKAIDQYEIVKQSKKDDFYAYANQAAAYMRKGLYNKAAEILQQSFNINPHVAWTHVLLAYTFICQSRFDSAQYEANKAISLNPDYYENSEYIGDILLMKGDLRDAKEAYQKLLHSEEPVSHLEGNSRLGAFYLLKGRFDKAIAHFEEGINQARKIGDKEWEAGFHSLLAYSYLKIEEHEKALEECDKSWTLALETEFLIMQKYALHYKGLTFLAQNQTDNAEKSAQELKRIIEKGLNKKLMRYYYHLKGMIELQIKNCSQAVKDFENALSLLPCQNAESWILYNKHALYLDSLAYAYFLAGNVEQAQKQYEMIIRLTMGRLFYGDIYAKSYYMLGKIYQQKDWKGKAIENYKTFLELWKEADPNIPEIKDAKKQLSILQSNK